MTAIPQEIKGESYVSLRMLELCCQQAREQGATGSEAVSFGAMNVDGTYSPYGPVLALGFSDGHLMVVVQDSPVPVLPQPGDVSGEQSFQVFFRNGNAWEFRFYARGSSADDLRRRIYYARKQVIPLADIRVEEVPEGHPLRKAT